MEKAEEATAKWAAKAREKTGENEREMKTSYTLSMFFWGGNLSNLAILIAVYLPLSLQPLAATLCNRC